MGTALRWRIPAAATVLAACLWPPACVLAQDAAGGSAGTVGELTLDYDVPESPAFVALGATPEQVLRGSAAKPVVASIANQLATGGALGSGVAVDFVPYAVYGGRLRSAQEYREDVLKRLLSNLSVSFGAIDAPEGVDATSIAVGARLSVWDSRDPLFDPVLIAQVDSALSAAADSDIEVDDDNETPDEEVDLAERGVDLSAVYDAARRRQSQRRGSSLAIGWAFAGTLQGRVLAGDSLDLSRHHGWAAFQYSVASGVDLLATARSRFATSDDVPSTWQLGVGARANAPATNFTAELVYDHDQDRINPSVSASVRMLGGLRLIASVVSKAPETGGNERLVRLHTAFQWNMSEQGN